ncbi:MAG: peptidase E [Cyanobacteria bacterium J06623_7]
MNLQAAIEPPLKQIVAMGGGGWSMEPNNPLLDWYIYKLSDKAEPKICFLPTASGDAAAYIDRFYQQFIPQPALLTHLSLFKPHTADIRSFILEQDIIYVGGGNTKNLLALWREWGLDKILRAAWERGVILSGLSAGSICWFAAGLTDSIPGKYTILPALGLLEASNCPHYDGEADRRPVYHSLVARGAIANGYAVDDGVGLHFVGQKLQNIVASRQEARAYLVENHQGQVKETPLQTQYLGN